jgi:uncharacterized protein (TIGR02246 family)
MTRNKGIVTAALAALAVAAAGVLYRLPADDKPAPGGKEPGQPESAEMAAVRKTADAYTRAFNAGDSKALASFWAKNAEYVGPDGETIRGRDDLEKSYAEFFKKNPKATIEVEIASVRLLGRHTALEEGSLKLRLPGDREPGVSRYSVLHIREDDGWKMASVREWVPDPDELVTLQDVAWLQGDWLAKGPEAEVRIRYAWDEDKAFLRGRYTVTRQGKVVTSGTQLIGKNPAGGLRSWVFDASGTFGESVWSRDEGRWVIDAAGTLPDGSEVTATNILIPLGKDAFTWQSIERTAAGSELPDTPPLKVTRVPSGK